MEIKREMRLDRRELELLVRKALNTFDLNPKSIFVDADGATIDLGGEDGWPFDYLRRGLLPVGAAEKVAPSTPASEPTEEVSE